MRQDEPEREPCPTSRLAAAAKKPCALKQPGFIKQIEACRREVAQWPDWMRQTYVVPAWMANHATDL